MEFEIMNDILTTVINEQLTNAPKPVARKPEHTKLAYDRMSQGSVGDNKDRISSGSFLSRGELNMSRNSRGSNRGSDGGDRGSLRRERGNNRRAPQGPVLKEDCSIEEWLAQNAPLLLEDSLRRLNLDLGIIDNRNLDLLSLSELKTEKKRVKNELKRYDSCFNNGYNRFPNRNEKEPMRPLYIYYKRLKQAISKSEVTTLPQGKRRARSQGAGERQGNPGVVSDNDAYREAIKKLDVLKDKRLKLRKKLEDYQVEFITNHNRRIRYRQDIIDVEDDYNLYKSLKEDIRVLEERVVRLRPNAHPRN